MEVVNSSKRFDCFVSYCRDQQLRSLKLPESHGCRTLDHFVEKILIPRLRNVDGRKPSVFQRSTDLGGRLSDVFDAILQLRGGGIALVLLTCCYIDDKRCVEELLALLSLANLKDDPERQDEAIEIRFVFLETCDGDCCDHRYTHNWQSCREQCSWPSVVEQIEKYNIDTLRFQNDLEVIARFLAEPVCTYWNSATSRPNLGVNKAVSFEDMERVFVDQNVRMLGRELNVNVETDYNYGVHDVMERARRDGTISFNNVDKLLEICERRRELKPEVATNIRSYQRKWCSKRWSWSAESRDRLRRLREETEADSAISTRRQDESEPCYRHMPQHSRQKSASTFVSSRRGPDMFETPTVSTWSPPGDVPDATRQASMLDTSSRGALLTETTTVYSVVSDLVRGCMDLVVYSTRALIAYGDETLLRMQEARVARALADCSDCLRLLGNKEWYFCGSNILPAFVVRMALMNQRDAARRKLVDILMSLSPFRSSPENKIDFRRKKMWDATTRMDVSFVNALIIKDNFRYTHGPRVEGKAEILNDINPVLNISASEMLLVLQKIRLRLWLPEDLAIVSKREEGLGWYHVQFEVDDRASAAWATKYRVKLEYICSLGTPEAFSMGSADMRNTMILNFLHTADISPEAKKLRESTGKNYSYMTTLLSNEANMYEGYQGIFDVIDVFGKAYTELLEIACINTLRAAYHAQCEIYVHGLVDVVDERQLVVSNPRRGRSMVLRRGKEISFDLLANEFTEIVMSVCNRGRLPSSCKELHEYGTFCVQEEVTDSWYDLLVPMVANEVNANFAQAALTGRGSYPNFVARHMSVRLNDSILLCDPASDCIAVAFDNASELSNSLKIGISELMTTTESERLRAAFFICRGAIRAKGHTRTRMVDVMRSRYMGLEGIRKISTEDVAEELDEGEERNPAVLVECMESLAMQGGYREGISRTTLFDALCCYRECDKTIVVTGTWPPLFGNFRIRENGTEDRMVSIRGDGPATLVRLQGDSQLTIVASREGNVYRTQRVGHESTTGSTRPSVVFNGLVCLI